MYEITDQYIETLCKAAHRELKQVTIEYLQIAYEETLNELDLKYLQGIAQLQGAEEVRRIITDKMFSTFKDNL